MTKQNQTVRVLIALLTGLMGFISIAFSVWGARNTNASFLTTGIWFPIGMFAVMVAVFLGLSAATTTTRK